KYIVPELISIKESMQWEIHKRAQLLLNQVEREKYAEPEVEGEIKYDDTINEDAKKILDVMMDNIDENTTEKLAERAKLSFAETKQIILYLRIEDYIITPRAGKFKKL
ncbi:MAG: hypothetical protein IH840_05600, partial [Candidatus Heimdallarchaeota archaeon]|nr:hypothetical protein [Candidatus Heimdallarchaeota archaeon]